MSKSVTLADIVNQAVRIQVNTKIHELCPDVYEISIFLGVQCIRRFLFHSTSKDAEQSLKDIAKAIKTELR